MPKFKLNLMFNGGVQQTHEIEAENRDAAYKMAHDHPLIKDVKNALWIDVIPITEDKEKQ